MPYESPEQMKFILEHHKEMINEEINVCPDLSQGLAEGCKGRMGGKECS